ncbi:hypothetical protein B0H63DRAFT_197390 [Podospora didyma]|uniref:Condensation domain-containing protein n=1 Tax=Podospora didyma TaxID=330526 RepID=A0AAE0TVK5_9PEZI|nr:hypothetical protein B0H63DRAFT_197390 [Podospora didyma]
MAYWTEVQPGLWQRPIGENEAMIKMIGDGGLPSGKDTWAVSATARFAGASALENLTQAVRDGWAALRFRHPSIAATVNGDVVQYHVPDEQQQLAQWLDETFTVLPRGENVDQILGTLPPPERFARCYYVEHTREVVLHLSHWRTDGIGALHLLDALFSAAVERLDPNHQQQQLHWGQEPIRLVPSVEQALNLPATPTEAITAATKTYLATLANARGALGIPAGASQGPTATRLPTLGFSVEQTTRLLLACQHRGIRFEAALNAAVTAAAYSIAATESKDQHHCSTLRHSLRPHLPAPYDGIAGAAGLYTAGYFVKVPADSSWIDNARYFESEYAKGATPDLLCSRRQYAREMKQILISLPSNTGAPPPSGLDMSWVPGAQDLVRTVYEDGNGSLLQVDRVGISVDVLSRHVYVFAWMFNGQIWCRPAFNRDFYNDGFADRVLGLVAEQLTRNLLDT